MAYWLLFFMFIFSQIIISLWTVASLGYFDSKVLIYSSEVQVIDWGPFYTRMDLVGWLLGVYNNLIFAFVLYVAVVLIVETLQWAMTDKQKAQVVKWWELHGLHWGTGK